MSHTMRAASLLLAIGITIPLQLPAGTLAVSVTNDHGSLALAWPAWATDGVLEESSEPLNPGSWTAVPAAQYQADSTALRYPLTGVTGSRYYRVRRGGPAVAGLAGYWPLDEGSGQLATGRGGSASTLYLTNVAWAIGRFGRPSLQFDSSASLGWVSNTNFQVLPPGGLAFSVAAWFSPGALPTGEEVLFTHGPGTTSGWRLALNNAGPGTNYLTLRSADGSTVSCRTCLLPGKWHQLAMSYASNQAALYLDSRLLAQGSCTLLNDQGPLYLGSATAGVPGFLGRLGEVRVYTNSLTQEQVSITGWWHFDENAGSVAADSSLQGNPAAVVPPTAWAPGKKAAGLDLAVGEVVIANERYAVLPPTGGPFTLSLWICPGSLPAGRSGLISCADGANRGWQTTVYVDDSAQSWLEVTSTNLGGTLALRAPVPLAKGAWTRLDISYNGGFATVYANGRKAGSEPGAIQAAPADLVLGAVPDTAKFNGRIDELKVYNRELQADELGPVASPLWEMALVNSATKLVLQGAGPPGKPLTYSIISPPTRGTMQLSPDSSLVTYRASAQKGPDSFVYTVSDGEFVSPPATGAVSVVQPHWITPNGGPQAPRDGSRPEQAWAGGGAEALDTIWATNNYYDCFFYAPGEYQTRGSKYLERFSANPGCKHIGSGSQGPEATVLKLVDTWGAWNEGVIFAGRTFYTDGFEVRNLVLDCNAQNNPKYTVGEPVWLRVPLTGTARVDQVTLRWADQTARSSPYQLGKAADFTVCTRTATSNGFVTNCVTQASTGLVDVVSVGTVTDELLLSLTRRADNVSYYGLREMEVAGASVSLPLATVPGGGESRIDQWHSMAMAVDGDTRTSWASGPETQVQITLPLAAGSSVSQVNFRWNCQTLPDLKRLGAAATYFIYARDPLSGQFNNVPFTSHGRRADGVEIATFGTGVTNSVVTDQLALVLVQREQGVDFYSLREVTLKNGTAPRPLRIPTSLNALGGHNVVKAFDSDTNTYWASGTQGAVAAIDVGGSNLKFLGLRVIGFGTKAGRECFPLAVIAAPVSAARPPFRNVLVEDCIFEQPATNNTDGLTTVAVLGSGNGSIINSLVNRVTVRGLTPYFGYSHAFGAVHVENCLVEDCQYGVYFEPAGTWSGATGEVLIRSNRFINVTKGVSVEFHPQAAFDSLLCLDNEIVLSGPPAQCSGIMVCDVCGGGASGVMTNLTALNNIVRYQNWTPRPNNYDYGMFYGNVQHAVYANNLIALGTRYALRVRPYPSGRIPDKPAPEDCDNPHLVIAGPTTYPPPVDVLQPGYRRAWVNNLDLSGALLPVLFSEFGVDRASVQQQW